MGKRVTARTGPVSRLPARVTASEKLAFHSRNKAVAPVPVADYALHLRELRRVEEKERRKRAGDTAMLMDPGERLRSPDGGGEAHCQPLQDKYPVSVGYGGRLFMD